ncbi:TPA: hypothetical protein NBL60_004019 [Enterobacter hormaechei]|nr:hypothetical protein [Enterobacter hormaechei]
MVEMPGSEFQIREIVFLVNLDYGDVYYRKTKDSNGDDYFLILNSTGEEVAEWDEDAQKWILLPHPRPTGNTQNSTNITHMAARIEKQCIWMSLCEGQLAKLPKPKGIKKKARRGP